MVVSNNSPLTINSRNGVDTFADRNSPSIVCHKIARNQAKISEEVIKLTIERTIIDSIGSGVV